MSRRIAGLLLAALLLTACGGAAAAPASPAASSTASAPAAAKPVTLTFWVIDPFTQGSSPAIDKTIQDFEAANPGIKVDVQSIAANAIHDKLVTAISGGGGPDVFSTDMAWMGEFSAASMLKDVTSELAPIKDQYLPGSLATVTFNGHYYGIPWYSNNVGIYYNKDIFAKSGISGPPATWDEFVKDAQTLKQHGYYALSLAHGGFGGYFFLSFLFENGGSIFGPDGRTLTLNSPQDVQAFQWFTDLYTKYHAVPDSVKSAFSWDQVYAPFIQGKAAMFIAGDFAKPALDAAKGLNWGVAPMPKGTTYGTVEGGYNLAIGANTKHPNSAWKLASYLTGPDAESMLESYGRVPARTDVADSSFAKSNPFEAVFIDQGKYAVPQPTNAAWPKVSNLLGDAFDAVIQGKSTPKAALDNVVKQGQPIVDSMVKGK